MKEKLLMIIAGFIAIPQFVWHSAWLWFNGVESTPETDPIHEMETHSGFQKRIVLNDGTPAIELPDGRVFVEVEEEFN